MRSRNILDITKKLNLKIGYYLEPMWCTEHLVALDTAVDISKWMWMMESMGVW